LQTSLTHKRDSEQDWGVSSDHEDPGKFAFTAQRSSTRGLRLVHEEKIKGPTTMKGREKALVP